MESLANTMPLSLHVNMSISEIQLHNQPQPQLVPALVHLVLPPVPQLGGRGCVCEISTYVWLCKFDKLFGIPQTDQVSFQCAYSSNQTHTFHAIHNEMGLCSHGFALSIYNYFSRCSSDGKMRRSCQTLPSGESAKWHQWAWGKITENKLPCPTCCQFCRGHSVSSEMFFTIARPMPLPTSHDSASQTSNPPSCSSGRDLPCCSFYQGYPPSEFCAAFQE